MFFPIKNNIFKHKENLDSLVVLARNIHFYVKSIFYDVTKLLLWKYIYYWFISISEIVTFFFVFSFTHNVVLSCFRFSLFVVAVWWWEAGGSLLILRKPHLRLCWPCQPTFIIHVLFGLFFVGFFRGLGVCWFFFNI